MNHPQPNAAVPAALIDAASVLLLRDGDQGLEVFMVQRHEKSTGFGGAYVFPGGKVDVDEGIPQAAAREVLEECGVQLDARQLQPWSRWVTPPNSVNSPTRRFDTRFFVAHMPSGQDARHDNHEAVHSQWFTPRAALHSYWQGGITLVPPQLMSLSHLASHASVDAVLQEASSRPPYEVHPLVTEVDGLRVMAYPGDPLVADTHRVMPGPTRLVVRNGRAEPLLGFDGFFSRP